MTSSNYITTTSGSNNSLGNSGIIDIREAMEWYFGQAGFMYDEEKRARKEKAKYANE